MALPDFSFGTWVKRRRKALDLTQQQLAQRVGCSISLVFKIESDERRPSRQIAELLAGCLEIPPEQHDLFLKVARQEKTVEVLEPIPLRAGPGPDPVSVHARFELPFPLTTLVGREHELGAIIQHFQDPACRLLTLTGPGGVGKTRLALEAAHQLRDSFDHGACFVSLVGTSAPEFMIPAIADSLGFLFSGTIDLKVQLVQFLREKQILLVLDNLEHLLNGIELLDELLENAPGLKLLTTSREQLNLRAEWAFEVQGLPIPSEIESTTLEQNSAVTLFIQRIKQVNVNFAVLPKDYPAIIRICQFVEGLPLGLELAATWARALSFEEIAREMERSIDFLSVKARDVPQRHRSMRAVFDQSWSLLSIEERRVLQRLAVFRGGFTREAAEQVADATLPLLSSLLNKSLVKRSQASRFELHELIRQYCSTHLQSEQQEECITRKKHADYYLNLLHKIGPVLRSNLQKETLVEIGPEIDNIRIAWKQAVASEDINLLRIATGPLYYYYELHQYFQEAESLYRGGALMLRSRLECLDTNDAIVERIKLEGALGDMLTHQAFFLQRMGHNQEAMTLHRTSINLLRPLQEPYPLTFALVLYGTLCWAVGDLKEAVMYLHEGLPVSRTLEHPWLQAIALCFLGAAAHDQGNYDEAHNWFSEAMELCQDMGDPYLTLLVSTLFSRTAQVQGRFAQTEDMLRKNLHIARETGNRWGIGLGLEQLAAVAHTKGDYAGSRDMLEESVELYQQVGDPWSLSRALNALSQLNLAQQVVDEAEKSARRAFDTARDVEYNLNALDALAILTEIRAQQGKTFIAFKLALFVSGHPASPQGARDRVEKILRGLESQLTSQQIEDARSHAESMTLFTITQELELYGA